jgi:hypothetical protein
MWIFMNACAVLQPQGAEIYHDLSRHWYEFGSNINARICIQHFKHVLGFWGKNCWNLFNSTLVIPFSEGGTKSQSKHYLAKSQSYWKLKKNYLVTLNSWTHACLP